DQYRFDWDGQIVSGHIRSIGPRLHSSLASQSGNLLLHPKVLAAVSIELTASTLPITPVRHMQRLVVVDPATQQTVATGLSIPDRDGGCTDTSDAPRGLAVWLTGFSGAGKTTIALQVQDRLRPCCAVEMLDGDIVRTYLCKDLGYSKDDRNENVRRLGFVAK